MAVFANERKKLVISEENKSVDIFEDTINTGLRGNTVFGISYGTCSSSLQKSVRRGIAEEAVQWALGMYSMSPIARTNLWNRLLVMTVEDVGPANILALPTVLDLFLNKDEDEVYRIALAAAYLAQSKKTRVNDWACYFYKVEGDEIEKEGMQNYYNTYVKALKKKDIERVLKCITCLAFCEEEVPLSLRRSLGSKKKYAQSLIWTGFDTVIGESKYLDRVKEIASLKNWNSKIERKGKTRLLYSHVAILWCLTDFKELDKHSEGTIKTAEEYIKVKGRLDQIKEFKGLYGVPDYAMDKHTIEGRKLKRGFEHFIEEGSYLENESEEWKDISNYFLKFFKTNML